MRKRLFDDEDRYSDLGGKVSERLRRVLDPLIKEMDEEGISLRDLELMIVREAGDTCSKTILARLLKERKARVPSWFTKDKEKK